MRSLRRGRPDTEGSLIFRPWTNIAVCAFWAVFGGIWLAGAAGSGFLSLLHQAPTVALISTVVYAVFGRPQVIVRDDGVLLRNVIRDVSIPFATFSRISTQYALTITTIDGSRYRAWAAPASGRVRAGRVTEEERRTLTWSGQVDDIPSSASLRSEAGAAALAIRRNWQRRLENPAQYSGAEPGSPAPEVQIRWATGVLVGVAACMILEVLVRLS